MKKVLFVLLAVVAMAGTCVEAKSFSKTPVGCWSLQSEHGTKSYVKEGNGQDTLLMLYRTDFDSLILCPKGVGRLEYRVCKRYVYTTEDGYEKVKNTMDEYCIRFRWKYTKGEVQFLSYSSKISCIYTERTSDNRGGKYPSRYNNNIDEEAVQYMIDLLPQLELEYNPASGHLYSYGYQAYYRRCKGKPVLSSTKVTTI